MKSKTSLAASLVAALYCVTGATRGAGQIAFGDEALSAAPLGLSISGGISLGSYQAGVNYGMLELYRRAVADREFRAATGIPVYQLRSVTGASAGNINTLLWAVEACTRVPLTANGTYRSPDPGESLFWQVWGSIGWEELFSKSAEENAVFDRARLIDSVAAPLLERRLEDPRLVVGCVVPAGITLTRIKPDALDFRGLAIETQRHATVFKVRVDSGAGPRVRFTQADEVPADDPAFGSLVRIAPDESDIPFHTLLNAVQASAAFPIAFAPVPLEVRYPRKPGEPVATHWFMDGGAFDNNPLGLTRELYRASAAPGPLPTLDILYVNPGRFRGDFAKARAQQAQPVSPGGLASVAQFVPGAILTARQYELQLLARERQQQASADSLVRELERLRSAALVISPLANPGGSPAAAALPRQPLRERLLLSSRAYPVFSEHLAAFAGFLARPAREFDFYVGLYDALHLATREYSCAPPGEPTKPEAAKTEQCIRPRLLALITDTLLVRQPGRQVLRWLYDREFDGASRDSASLVALPDSAMEERIYVQRAIFRALETQYRRAPDGNTCVDPSLVLQVLCSDGLYHVLESIARDRQAVRIISRWSECPERRRCEVEAIFRRLLDDPMRGSTQLLDDIFQRVRIVESRMAADTTRAKDDYLQAVTAVQWFYNASHLRSRPRIDWIPNAVPTTSLLRLVPLTYLGANLGAGGVEGRWEPAFNFGNSRYVHASAILHYTRTPEVSTQRWYGGLGGGVGLYFDKVWVSQAGLAVHSFIPLMKSDGAAGSFYEVEPYAVLLAGQLRASFRWLPQAEHHGQVHGPDGWTLSVGFADPVGLLYWIGRLQ